MKRAMKTGFAAILLIAVSCKKESSNLQSPLTDNDASDLMAGMYAHVKIGTQVWMTKNLDVTHYRNGNKIPQVKDPGQWAALTTGAWCWYNNDSASGAPYGRMYNWYAVNDPRGLAPKGWHVPGDAEWDTLATHLKNNVGGRLKDTGTIEAGTGLWYAPNYHAVNGTGFTGLPGGMRFSDGTFANVGLVGILWSSTENYTYSAWDRGLNYYSGTFNTYYDDKRSGFSVRCIKD